MQRERGWKEYKAFFFFPLSESLSLLLPLLYSPSHKCSNAEVSTDWESLMDVIREESLGDFADYFVSKRLLFHFLSLWCFLIFRTIHSGFPFLFFHKKEGEEKSNYLLEWFLVPSLSFSWSNKPFGALQWEGREEKNGVRIKWDMMLVFFFALSLSLGT